MAYCLYVANIHTYVDRALTLRDEVLAGGKLVFDPLEKLSFNPTRVPDFGLLISGPHLLQYCLLALFRKRNMPAVPGTGPLPGMIVEQQRGAISGIRDASRHDR